MVKQLFKGHESILTEWFDRALADDSVWPYLGAGQLIECWELKSDDWYNAYFIDDTGNGLLKITADRCTRNALSCGLWVLNVPEKSPVAASLIGMVPRLCSRYGLNWIEGGVAESNKDSIRMHEKIFHAPVGIFEEGWFNRLTGQWENFYWYRDKISNVMARFNPNRDV